MCTCLLPEAQCRSGRSCLNAKCCYMIMRELDSDTVYPYHQQNLSKPGHQGMCDLNCTSRSSDHRLTMCHGSAGPQAKFLSRRSKTLLSTTERLASTLKAPQKQRSLSLLHSHLTLGRSFLEQLL